MQSKRPLDIGYETVPEKRPCFLDIKGSNGKMKNFNDQNKSLITIRYLHFNKKTKKFWGGFSLTLRGARTRMSREHRILLTSWSKYIIKFKTLKVWLQQRTLPSVLRTAQTKGLLFVVGVSGILKIICLSKI